MPDTVIDPDNILGKDKQELLICTDGKVRLIGYGDIKLTGVDGCGDKHEAPLKVEN